MSSLFGRHATLAKHQPRVHTVECLQLDETNAMKDGVWEAIGAAGGFQFKRYEDNKVRSERELSNGAMQLSPDMGESIHDVARSYLKTAKPMTLEDLDNLQSTAIRVKIQKKTWEAAITTVTPTMLRPRGR